VFVHLVWILSKEKMKKNFFRFSLKKTEKAIFLSPLQYIKQSATIRIIFAKIVYEKFSTFLSFALTAKKLATV
jgi:hypothetical protein